VGADLTADLWRKVSLCGFKICDNFKNCDISVHLSLLCALSLYWIWTYVSGQCRAEDKPKPNI